MAPMKTKFTMIMAVIATFAISLNLHSSNEKVVFGAPAVQMPRGGEGVYTVLTTKTVTTQVGLSYSPMHNFPRCNQRE